MRPHPGHKGGASNLAAYVRNLARGFLGLALVVVSFAVSATPETDRAIGWLTQQVQADGSLASEGASLATPLQARAESAVALQQFGVSASAVANAVAAMPATTTEYLARQVVALYAASIAASAPMSSLLALQNADGGFAPAQGYASDALDTAYALLALRTSPSANASAVSKALGNLTSAQGTDGSFAINGQSSVFVTSLALQSLNAFAATYALTTPVQSAKTWLVGSQTSGAYTTTLDNAVAALALAGATLDSTAFAGAQSALKAAQAADGSWSDDPFLTALATRALAASASAPPPATTGQLSGSVVDQSTSAALSGVAVQLSGPQSASATTDSTGSFIIVGLAPGTYSVQFSKAGYARVTLGAPVTAGVVSNVGTVRLQISTTTASVTGTVRDAGTGQAIAGATVVVSGGPSTTTDAAGAYQLPGLAPGTVTITVSQAGYQSVSVTTTLNAGVVTSFSPALYSGSAPTQASLQAHIVDRATSAAIAGATLAVGTATATANGTGDVSLAGLATGDVTFQLSAAGYISAGFSATLAPGINNVGTIALDKVPASITVSGMVTDSSSSQAIGGATVHLTGTTLAATTDSTGAYALTGVTQTSFTLAVSAPGYQSKNVSVTLPALANSTVNVTLDKTVSTGISITQVLTDKTAYDPYTAVELQVSVQNVTSSPVNVALSTSIIDPLGNDVMDVAGVFATIPATTTAPVTVDTHIASQAAGAYSVVVHAYDANSLQLLAEGTASFAINAVTRLGGGITLDPPITQVGTNQAVHMTANLTNMGNLPIAAGGLQLTVTLANPDTSVSPSATTELLPGGTVGSPLAAPVGGGYDSQGNFYVVNRTDRRVLKRTPDGQISTVVQLPTYLSSQYVQPQDSKVDSAGNVYVLNSTSQIIEVTPSGSIIAIPTGLSSQLTFDRDAAGNFAILQTYNGSYRIIQTDPSGAQTGALLAGVLSAPRGIAQGADGAFYVTNHNDNSIWRMAADGTLAPFVATGLSGPGGIAVDSSGTFYVVNQGTNSLLKVSSTGQISAYASGLSQPNDVALDAQGNAYVSNQGNNTVVKILPGGATQVFARSLSPSPDGMAYDAAGTLYIAGGDGNLVKLDAAANWSSSGGGLSIPRQVAIGFNGDAFVANYGNGTITRSGTATPFAAGLLNPFGLAFDGTKLYASESSSTADRIVAFDASGNKSVVAETMLTDPKGIYVAPNGDRYLLSANQIAKMPVSAPGTIFTRGGLSAMAFAPANDGGFFVQEISDVRRVSPTGAVTMYKSGLPTLVYGVVADASNNLFVGDNYNKRILRIDTAGNVTTFASLPDYPYSLIDDQAGGLYVATSGGYVLRVTSAGVVSYVTSSRLSATALALDTVSDKLYLGSGTSLRVLDLATSVVSTVLNRGSLYSIAFDGTNVLAIDYSRNEFVSVTPQGVATPLAAGFNNPSAMAWTGSQLYFVCTSNVYTLVPGGYPQLVLSGPSMRDLAWSNGQLYGVSGGSIYTLGATSWIVWKTQPAGNTLSAMAARGDGAITVGSDSDGHVYTFDASAQLSASYAGITQPAGLAVDASGNVYVGSQSQLVRITPDRQSTILATGFSASGLTVDASGNVYAGVNASPGRVVSVSPTGAVTQVATSTGSTSLFGITISTAGTFVVDRDSSMVRKVVGTQAVPIAAGLASPGAIRFDPSGAVLVASSGNGTVASFANGQASTRAFGLNTPYAMGFGPTGLLMVSGNNGYVYQVDSSGTATLLTTLDTFFGSTVAVTSLGVNSQNTIALVMNGRNEFEQLAFVPAQPGPSAGTVVYTGSTTFSGLAVDSIPTSIDFGSWLPTFGGDYRLSVQAQDGTQGEAVNMLHVGPNATAQIATSAPTVPPGNSPIGVNVNVQGGDFTSLAKVDGTNVSVAISTGVYPRAMGADPSGNILVSVGDSHLYKFTPQGVKSILYTLASGSINLFGAVPIDDAGNAYISTGAQVLRVAPDGTAQSVAALSETVIGLGITSSGVVIALTSSRVSRIASDGTLTTLTGVSSPYAMTVDGRDDVYVQLRNNGIIEVKADGTVVNVLNPNLGVQFEGEGMNIAGDCADNVFVTPYYWPAVGQYGEEYSLVQIVSSTGQAAQILDGRKLNPQLTDLDFIVYDRFTGTLLMWTDLSGGRMYRIPVTCGAISTELHLVFPATQPAGSFSSTPSATLAHTDGSIEYAWSLQNVTNLGQSVSLQTTLQNMKLGDMMPVASAAFLAFQNTFVAGTVTVPLKIPTVGVDAMVDMAVSTDQPQYDANTDVLSLVHMTNRDMVNAKSGTLTVIVADPQGVQLAMAYQQPATIAAGSTLDVNPPFNTATYLTGTYQLKATLTDANGFMLASGAASFDIVASPVSLISSVTTDKQSYNAYDTVNITSRVKNVSVNGIADNLTTHVTVMDPAGAQKLSASASIAVLMPQALKDSGFVLALSDATAGSYVVNETLTDASGTVLDQRSTTFSVASTADTGSGLVGTLSASPAANQGHPVNISVTLQNQGNAALSAMPVTVKVVDPVSGNLVTQWVTNIDLAVNAQQTVPQAWDTTGVAAGTYVVAASASISGRDIALGQSNIKVGVIQPFTFASKTNVPLDTLTESDPVTLAGIVAPAAISISGGEYRVGSNGWTAASGFANPGDTVTVRLTSAASYNTTSSATLTVESYSTPFSVTTVNPDITPDPFTFTALTNVPLSTLEASNAVTITSIDIPVPISIVGGEYSINGGPWTSAAGMVGPNDSVTVRQTSAAALGTMTVVTLTVSGVSGAFDVTTTAIDSSPDPFSFAPQSNVPVSTLRTSNTAQITGINVAVPISVVGGQYSVNGGAYTSAAGTVSNGDNVTVQQTSSASFSTTVTTKLTVSDFTAAFETTTEGEDTTPDPFSFTEQLDVPLMTDRTSNAVTITGINTSVPISVDTGSYSVNGGAFTAATGTVKSGDVVVVKQTSAATFATKTTVNVTVSQFTAQFAVTTKSAADVKTTPAFASDARVLLLVSCKVNGAANGADDPTCVANRVSFLDSYFTSLGIGHTIVTSATDYEAEMRSGRYNTYWVSGGAIKLQGTLDEETREASFRGESLVVDGVHDDRNRTLDEALGVFYMGKPSGLSTVTMPGPVLPAGSFSVAGAAPIRVQLIDATRQAVFNTGDPAISTSVFGYGKSMLYAFDLPGTIMPQSSLPLLSAMVGQSIAFITPTVPLTFTGNAYVPLTFTLKNAEPVGVDLQVVATLPDGFAYVTSTPAATATANTVTWSIHVDANSTQTVDWAVRTPSASGSYAIAMVVDQLYGSSAVQLATPSMDVEVRAIDTVLPGVIAQLGSLGLTSSEKNARDAAIFALNAAQSALNAGQWDSAIADLVAAVDKLDAITSVPIASYQAAIDNVMKQAEQLWCAALPPCPGTSPCRTP